MSKYLSPLLNNLKELNSKNEGYSISCFNKYYKIINFSPGPAQINKKILDEVKNEIFKNDSKYKYGVTPFEMSHRSPEFNNILDNVNDKLRLFMKIPKDFVIIWTQGGGHGQFSSIPLNMKRIFKNVIGGYYVTGTWSSRAYEESKKFIKSHNLNEIYYKNYKNPIEYNILPEKFIKNEIDYLYLCSNETVNGTEFKKNGISLPNRKQLGKTKLVVDMSSDFLMKEVDWSCIDVAFACTSKNMGLAGSNVLILRRELLNNYDENEKIPCILDWKLYHDSGSLYNTPSVFNLYLFEKILDCYFDEMKNITQMDNYNQAKAQYLYDYLDNSKLFKCSIVDIKSRSNINIPFIVGNGNPILRCQFLDYCYKHNVIGLRTKTPFNYEDLNLLEPLRISLYNGIELEDVKYLIKIMENFEKIVLE